MSCVVETSSKTQESTSLFNSHGIPCGLNFAYPFNTVRARTSDVEEKGNNKSRKRQTRN
jgi:hypothetical protein